MGVRITYTGRQSSFWYPATGKRQVPEIVSQHFRFIPSDRDIAVAEWLTGADAAPEPIDLSKV